MTRADRRERFAAHHNQLTTQYADLPLKTTVIGLGEAPAEDGWKFAVARASRLRRGVCSGLACALLAGCGGFSAGPAERAMVVPSPNHNARRPNFVILHDTGSGNVEHALRTLTDPAREVSSHYLIGRDGTLYQLVDEDRRAWHAGASWWGGNTDLNSASIGIELDNTGAEPYSEAQIVSLLDLLKGLQERYRIPANNFLGHGDVAVRRKVDPSRYFPWERLAGAGYGLWCQEPSLAPIADRSDPPLELQAIGYDVSDPVAALAAFRRHFLGVDREGEASEVERQWMRCLVLEKRQKSAPFDSNPSVGRPVIRSEDQR